MLAKGMTLDSSVNNRQFSGTPAVASWFSQANYLYSGLFNPDLSNPAQGNYRGIGKGFNDRLSANTPA